MIDNVSAQNQPTSVPPVFWNLAGNAASNSDFLGTRNFTPLIFRTNDVERIRISERGDIILPEIANGVQQILGAETNGKVVGMSIQTLIDKINELQECKNNGDPTTTTYPGANWKLKSAVGYGITYVGNPCPARVGIGKDNPSYSLHVIGTVGSNGYIADGGGYRAKITSTLNKAFTVYNNTAGKENFVVYGDGFVFAREVQVTSNAFVHPDYVFEKDYKLMPLDELELFVKQYKHLPNIPSAKEVEAAGGIKLAEMNTKLLEKVEELTLYIIEMKKEIEELKKQKTDN